MFHGSIIYIIRSVVRMMNTRIGPGQEDPDFDDYYDDNDGLSE